MRVDEDNWVGMEKFQMCRSCFSLDRPCQGCKGCPECIFCTSIPFILSAFAWLWLVTRTGKRGKGIRSRIRLAMHIVCPIPPLIPWLLCTLFCPFSPFSPTALAAASGFILQFRFCTGVFARRLVSRWRAPARSALLRAMFVARGDGRPKVISQTADDLFSCLKFVLVGYMGQPRVLVPTSIHPNFASLLRLGAALVIVLYPTFGCISSILCSLLPTPLFPLVSLLLCVNYLSIPSFSPVYKIYFLWRRAVDVLGNWRIS